MYSRCKVGTDADVYVLFPLVNRYDRDFLLQFMQVCQENPDAIPRLRDLQIASDSANAGIGAGRPQRPCQQSQMGPPGRSASGINTPFGAKPGGFAMGNFTSAGAKGTSADRFAALNAGGMRSISVSGGAAALWGYRVKP